MISNCKSLCCSPGSEKTATCQELPSESGLPSRGSKNHFRGKCRPCRVFLEGKCSAGVSCNFCHLSHNGRYMEEVSKHTGVRKGQRKREARHLFLDSYVLVQEPDNPKAIEIDSLLGDCKETQNVTLHAQSPID